MNPLPHWIELLGLTSPWTYGALFLAASLLLVWRLEALLDHGLEGTALATLVMPYCSGLGNLLLVWIVARQNGPAGEIAVNAVVNNMTNLTLLLGLPALIWGLRLTAGAAPGTGGKARGKRKSAGVDPDLPRRLNKLALLLTLTAGLFFTGAVWALGRDGAIDLGDGLVLVGLFAFWQTVQAHDVLKHNARQRVVFSPFFYADIALVLLGAWGMFTGLEWIVTWLSSLETGFVSAANLGWLTGWLMVIPNALLAFYYAHRRRAEVVFASQIGDGHICIPLMIGLYALWQPVPVSATMSSGLLLIGGALIVHLGCVLALGGLPRWLGAVLIAAYGWFVWTGLAG
ncbi:MAG: sodium:calcium symporter [Verrucomicrobiota bacterium]